MSQTIVEERRVDQCEPKRTQTYVKPCKKRTLVIKMETNDDTVLGNFGWKSGVNKPLLLLFGFILEK